MRVHRSTPSRAFTPLRNALIQDTRLCFGAHGLLDYLLSLEDGTPTDIKSLAAKFPDGQAAIAGYFRDLVRLGYVVRRKVRQWVEELGRWVVRTVVEVFDIPQAVGSDTDLTLVQETEPQVVESLGRPSLEDTSPPPSGVKTGPKSGNNPPSRPPRQEPIPDLGGRDEVVIDEAFRPCVEILRQIGNDDIRLHLGTAEMLPLLPLVAEWLARGATAGQVRQALTQGLPLPLYSPGKLIQDRLTRKMPPERASVTQFTPARPKFAECDECGRPTAGQCDHGENSGVSAGAADRRTWGLGIVREAYENRLRR